MSASPRSLSAHAFSVFIARKKYIMLPAGLQFIAWKVFFQNMYVTLLTLSSCIWDNIRRCSVFVRCISKYHESGKEK